VSREAARRLPRPELVRLPAPAARADPADDRRSGRLTAARMV